MKSATNSATAEPAAHRLVIVEGIMGSGKSTTMRFIARNLRDSGLPALPLHERTEPHPVRATDELEHWFEPWRDTTPQLLASRALVRWTAFVEATQRDSPISVMDGQLFHGDLTHLLLMDADSALISDYVSALAAIIAPLNPFVLYLWQKDVGHAIRTVCTERGSEWIVVFVSEYFDGVPWLERVYQAGSLWDAAEMGGAADVHCYTPAEFERKREQLPIVRATFETGLELLPEHA